MADGGDYLGLVKANNKGWLGETFELFEPMEWGVGFNQAPLAFEQATYTEKGHGRLEHRTSTISSELAPYRYWPHLAQVFKLEREWTELGTGLQKPETG